MSTIENLTPIQSRLIQTRHLSTLKQHSYNNMNDECSSTNDFNVTFAKDEKKYLTPYEKLLYDTHYDARFKAEENAGKRIGFYRILKDIGYGNFSRVKLGMHILAKEKVAMKILDKTKLDDKTQRLLLREITSMIQLHHPNIICLYEVIETPKEIYMVTEYASGGDLYTRITDNGKLSEDEAKRIFAQIVSAVDHMHSKGIIHRDIKSENVFFAKEHFIKLGDFGFSTHSEKNQTLTTFCGSPPYAAPELYRDESYIGIYVDIWAMGITLYFMITALMPFRAENVGKLRKSIIDGHYSIPAFVSNQCQELIHGLLNYEITERWSIEKIRSCAWLTKQNFIKEIQPFPTNLNNYSTSVMKTKTMKTSLEYQAYTKLEELGITSDFFQTIDDIRNPINGTYRIILHRLQKQSNSLERDDLYDKKIKDDLPTTYGRSLSFPNEIDARKHRHVNNGRVADTAVCIIL